MLIGLNLINSTLQPWNWNQFIYTTFNPTGRSYARNLKVLHDFTKNVIAERRARRSAGTTDTATDETGQKKKQPFLDMLLDARDDDGQPLTDAGMAESDRGRGAGGRSKRDGMLPMRNPSSVERLNSKPMPSCLSMQTFKRRWTPSCLRATTRCD